MLQTLTLAYFCTYGFSFLQRQQGIIVFGLDAWRPGVVMRSMKQHALNVHLTSAEQPSLVPDEPHCTAATAIVSGGQKLLYQPCLLANDSRSSTGMRVDSFQTACALSVGSIMRLFDSLSWYCSGPFHLRCKSTSARLDGLALRYMTDSTATRQDTLFSALQLIPHLHPGLLQQFLQCSRQPAYTTVLCADCKLQTRCIQQHDTAWDRVLTWKYRLEKPVGELVQGPSKLQGQCGHSLGFRFRFSLLT